MRKYEQTHPWINFGPDLRHASYKLWILLGKAIAKCDHVTGVPLKPAMQQRLLTVFLAKGALATTAIEGNTLTEEEAIQRVEGKLDLPPSKEYLGQEIDNIVEACNLIMPHSLQNKDTDICVEDIKRYNALVLKDIPLGEDVVPGQIRTHQVGVGNYRGAPPEDLDYLMERFCEWLNNFRGLEDKVALNILKAIHVYLAWIHPFADGNGRTARLIEYQILLTAGVPVTAAHLLSNHYNQTRSEYYRRLDSTHHQTEGQEGLLGFIEYALQGFVDNLDSQISMIEAQQLEVHWHDYVHEVFKGPNSVADARRRDLVLALSKKIEPIPVAQLRYISPRIAEAYANKTQKTVQRDLNELEEMKLIKKTSEGVIANMEIMRAFIPPKRAE
jgi:Fic family protein